MNSNYNPGYPGAAPANSPTGDAEAGRGFVPQGTGYQRKEGLEGGDKPDSGGYAGVQGATGSAQGYAGNQNQLPYGMAQPQAGQPSGFQAAYNQVLTGQPPALGIPVVNQMVNNPRFGVDESTRESRFGWAMWILFILGIVFPFLWIIVAACGLCLPGIQARRAAISAAISLCIYIIIAIVMASLRHRY